MTGTCGVLVPIKIAQVVLFEPISSVNVLCRVSVG